MYSGVGESRVLPTLLCEVGITCSLTGKLYKGPKLEIVLFLAIFILGRAWCIESTH